MARDNALYYQEHRAARVATNKRSYAKHAPRIRAARREYARNLRQQAIVALGGVCVRCGFSDARALQFDHIKGGGNQELTGNGWPAGYVQKIVSGERPDLQLLCANCNWIKRAEEGEAHGRPLIYS